MTRCADAAAPMSGVKLHGVGFTLFLAALSAVPPLSIDTSLPGIALIESDLHASQASAAAVIAIFLAGFSTAPLAIGPISDRFGRKPVMLAGLALFTLCALGCALAPSIEALLALRLVQGASASAVAILPRAIIRDLFEGREARLAIAAVSLVFSAAPLVGPSLGASILLLGSWRLIYVALAIVGAALAVASFLLFDELHPAENRRSLKPSMVLAGYRRAFANPSCAGFALLGGLVFAGLFAYVNVSPLLFMQGYGMSKAAFAGLFAITASGVMIGSSLNAWLLNRHTRPKTVLDAALAAECAAAVALLVVGLAGAANGLIVAVLVMIYISSFGLIFPNASHEAVQPLPEIAGLASAIVITTQMLFGAAGGIASAALYRDASPVAIGAIMSAAALAAAGLYVFRLRRIIEA